MVIRYTFIQDCGLNIKNPHKGEKSGTDKTALQRRQPGIRVSFLNVFIRLNNQFNTSEIRLIKGTPRITKKFTQSVLLLGE